MSAPRTGPPPILQIYRERLKPGVEAAYQAIEEETARFSVSLGCPHPYLAAQLLTGAAEVWWFNGFASMADRQRVSDEYAANAPFMDVLSRNSARKASLTLDPIEAIASYRPDLTIGAPWILGRGRFLVVATIRGQAPIYGTVFEADDGLRYVVIAAQTRDEADSARARYGGDAYICGVRPSFSFPAPEWIAADPSFWQAA